MYTYVHNVIAKTINSFYKALISMPFPWVAFLFENPVQHSPVLSQFSIGMIGLYYILVDPLFLTFLYSLLPGGVVSLRYCSGISETVFKYNPPV